MGLGIRVGSGEVCWRGGLPSTRALVILAARAKRLLREGFWMSRVGVLEWSLDGKGGPWPLVGLGLWLFLAGGVVGRSWGLPLLR